MTVGGLAETLFLRHHSAVELANRLVKAGFVERGRDLEDARRAVLGLTPQGEATMFALASSHVHEIRARGPELVAALSRVIGASGTQKRKSKSSSALSGVRKRTAKE
jgi:DNA-binding MarR family transcriptional regulator